MTEYKKITTNGLEETRQFLMNFINQNSFPLSVIFDLDEEDALEVVKLTISLDKEYKCWPTGFLYTIQGDNDSLREQIELLMDQYMLSTKKIIPN